MDNWDKRPDGLVRLSPVAGFEIGHAEGHVLLRLETLANPACQANFTPAQATQIAEMLLRAVAFIQTGADGPSRPN